MPDRQLPCRACGTILETEKHRFQHVASRVSVWRGIVSNIHVNFTPCPRCGEARPIEFYTDTIPGTFSTWVVAAVAVPLLGWLALASSMNLRGWQALMQPTYVWALSAGLYTLAIFQPNGSKMWWASTAMSAALLAYLASKLVL